MLAAALLFSRARGHPTRKEPPGPWGLPLLGYLPFVGRKMHLKLTDLAKRYGDVYQIRLGSRKIIVVNGQRAIKNALVGKNDFAGRPDFYSYRTFSKSSGEGNLGGFETYSPEYMAKKQALVRIIHSFTHNRREELGKVAQEALDYLVGEIEKRDGEPFHPEPILYRTVSIIMGYICYGKEYDKDSPHVTQLLNTANNFGKLVAFGVLYDYIPVIGFLLKDRLKKFEELLQILSECQEKMAPASKEALLKTYEESKKTVDKEGKAFIITEDNVADIARQLFSAGFGQIATTLDWAIMLMAVHPEVQQKVQKEIEDVVGLGSEIQFDDEKRLPYTVATVHEVLRYHSMAPLAITHSTICDTELDGYFIPKDTAVIINLYSVHRDSTLFPNPDTFDPDRFIKEDGSLNKEVMNNVIPFSLGQRRCFAESLSRLEIFVFFASLLSRCTIEESPDHPLDPNNHVLTFGLSLNPYKVIIRSRTDDKED